MEVWNHKGTDIFKFGKGQFRFDNHQTYPTLGAAKKDIDRLLKERDAMAKMTTMSES